MTITFKDVGQGDSIILEWEEKGINKIGIIDCNKKGYSNPTLQHLKIGKYAEVEFIILSHPHRDHFSGLRELFDHILKNKIIIRRLGHTLHFTNEAYWKYLDIDSKASRQLSKVVEKMRDLWTSGLLVKRDVLSDEKKPIQLGEHIHLHCLGPCHEDVSKYQDIVEFEPDKNILAASEAANHLSTTFILDVGDVSILLTADAENLSFDNLIKYVHAEIDKRTFHLCQVAHHGSLNNLHEDFWKLVPTADEKHAIISAGENKKYSHPSYQVVEAFANSGYSVHCTNIVNGMSEYTETLRSASLVLDGVSELAEEYLESNDRVFLIADGKCELH